MCVLVWCTFALGRVSSCVPKVPFLTLLALPLLPILPFGYPDFTPLLFLPSVTAPSTQKCALV